MIKDANGKYSVTTMFYDRGAVEARETKPEDEPGDHDKYDLYMDVFDTEKEALEFIETARRESEGNFKSK